MKKIKASLAGLLLIACCLHAAAQDEKLPLKEPDLNKPKLFADLPSKMTLKVAEMDVLFRFSVGTAINMQLNEKLSLQGTVVSKSDATDALVQSVVIRSSNRQGATFTFTRTTAADGSFAYLGRMMNRNNGDAYELAQENGQYVLVKKNLYDLINE